MTPDERQWCLDELARQGCNHGPAYASYDQAKEHLYCACPHIRCVNIWITTALITQYTAQTKAAKAAARANALNGPSPVRHILSQHGNKPIPVVPSHSAIAAMKQAQTPTEMRLDYKTHILVGNVASGVGVLMLQVWQHLPSQAEIDQVIAADPGRFTSYALVAPVGLW